MEGSCLSPAVMRRMCLLMTPADAVSESTRARETARRFLKHSNL